MLLNAKRSHRDERGFTLVELLITVLIVTIGLLGLAKLQATAVANTSISRTRALMTYQAESLAGMIRANKAFWQTTGLTTYPGFTLTQAGVPSDNGNLMVKYGGTGSCLNLSGTNTCTPANLAWDDMYNWAAAFNDGTPTSAFPGARVTITCVPLTGSACVSNPASPNGYDITLTWDQKQVAVNRSTAGSTTSPVSMVMHVQP
jgi:type IV pilus assembly protein PilV